MDEPKHQWKKLSNNSKNPNSQNNNNSNAAGVVSVGEEQRNKQVVLRLLVACLVWRNVI